MPTFTYTAANNRGQILNGELETSDIKTVIDYLSSQELMVVSVKPKEGLSSRLNSISIGGTNLSVQDKLLLTKHLATIIRAGLSLKEGVETILNDTDRSPLKKVLTDAKFNLEKGQPLSVTFKKYSQSFSPIFIALVEAGEVSGTLEKSLEYLGVQINKDYKLAQKIKGALVYPTVLIVAAAAVIGILMVFVIPRLEKVFSQSNIALPWSTQLIIRTSTLISSNLYIIIALLISLMIFIVYFRKNPYFLNFLSSLALKIPMVSTLYQKIILARFTRVLGTLLGSGIGILQALDLTSEAVGSGRYRKAIQGLKTEVSKGVSVSNTLRQSKIFPYMVVNLVSVGEKSGKIDSVLMELANYYEEEVDNDLKNVVALLEPVLLLFMGLVVAGIAFSVIMPIYQMVGSVK